MTDAIIIMVVVVVVALCSMFLHVGIIICKSINKLYDLDEESIRNISDTIYKEIMK